MIRCIAIDDEPLALRQMEMNVNKVASLHLQKTFSSAVQARKWLETETTDLIFVDINMPDINGVDFVRSLENPPMIVFTTAYADYAIDGFKLDAIDYLLKPFSFQEFQHAVSKAESLQKLRMMQLSETTQAEVEIADANQDCISVRADHKSQIIRLSNIVYMESAGEYVCIHMAEGNSVVTLFRLKNMEVSLPDRQFMRVHRSYIVNRDYIASYATGKIFLRGEPDDFFIPVGELYKKAFKDWMNEG